MDVDYSLNNTYWSDIGFIISWDFNCSDHYFPDPIYVPSSGDSVDFGADPFWRSDPLIIGEASWILEVVDANSDGIVNAGDSVSFITDEEESIPAIGYLALRLMYEPIDTDIDRVILIDPE